MYVVLSTGALGLNPLVIREELQPLSLASLKACSSLNPLVIREELQPNKVFIMSK
jgi:hypothetical protein